MDIKIHVDMENELMKFHTIQNETTVWEIGECRISDFNQEIAKLQQKIGSEIIPNAVRLIRKKPDGSYLFIFEQKPQYRLFQWTPESLDTIGEDVDKESDETFYIPVPWTQYVVTVSPSHVITNIQVYFCNKSLNFRGFAAEYSFDAVISNIYPGANLCRPITNLELEKPEYTSILSLMNQVESEVWFSGSNMDLYSTISGYYDYWVNIGEFCDCDDEDCDLNHTEGDYPNTLFDHINSIFPETSFRTLLESNWKKFSREYYMKWQAVPMRSILNTQWGNPSVGVMLSNMYGTVGFINKDKKPFLSNSDILMCAQNAIMKMPVQV